MKLPMLVTRERPLGVRAGVVFGMDGDADGGVVRPVTGDVCVCPFFGMVFDMSLSLADEKPNGALSDWLLRRPGVDGERFVLRWVSNSLLESKDGARAASS